MKIFNLFFFLFCMLMTDENDVLSTANGGTIIVIGNGVGDTSSNPDRGSLRFSSCNYE